MTNSIIHSRVACLNTQYLYDSGLCKDWRSPVDEVEAVAKKFVLANCLNPDIAAQQFTDTR